MRPRKNLALYSDSPEWSAFIQFALETRLSARCFSSDEPGKVAALVIAGKCDGVVLLGVGAGAEAVLRDLPASMPVMVVLPRKVTFKAAKSAAVVHWNQEDAMMSLVDGIRIMLLKKRGPKKHEAVQ